MLEIFKSKLFRTIIICTVSMLAIIITWKLYQKLLKWQKGRPIFIRKPHDGTKKLVIPNKDLPKSDDGYSYSLMFWINIDDYSYRRNEWKHVVHIGSDNSGDDCQPGVWLTPDKNDMLIRYELKTPKGNLVKHNNKIFKSLENNYNMKHYYKKVTNKTLKELKDISDNMGNNGFTAMLNKSDVNYNDNLIVKTAFIKTKDIPEDNLKNKTDVDSNFVTFKYQTKNVSLSPEASTSIKDPTNKFSTLIENMPIKRWTHVNIMVNEFSSDVYIDGFLRKSTSFASLIKPVSGNMHVSERGGFGGRITQLRVYNKVSTPDSARVMYNLGPDPPTLPDLRNPFGKFIPKVNFVVQVDADTDIPFLTADQYYLCDDELAKKKSKEMEKSEGLASSKEWLFTRARKLKDQKTLLKKSKRSFADFCKEESKNKGQFTLINYKDGTA